MNTFMFNRASFSDISSQKRWIVENSWLVNGATRSPIRPTQILCHSYRLSLQLKMAIIGQRAAIAGLRVCNGRASGVEGNAQAEPEPRPSDIVADPWEHRPA